MANDETSVRLSFMGVIAQVTKEKELSLACRRGVTLREVLDRAEEKYGPDFGRRLYSNSSPPRRLQMHTRIFINGNLVDNGCLDEALPMAGDDPAASPAQVLVYLMPAASGG